MGIEVFIGIGGFILTICVVTGSVVWQAGLIRNQVTELRGEMKLTEQRSESRLQKALTVLREDTDARLDLITQEITELKYRVANLEK